MPDRTAFENLPVSARKFQNVLWQHDKSLKVSQLPASTHTARQAATELDCHIGEIAKSIIFKLQGCEEAALVVASGQHHIDVNKVEALLGRPLEKASAAWVKANTGFVIGGVPPLGHEQPLTTLLDSNLQNFERIWAAAGAPDCVFCISPALLASVTQAPWCDVTAN